MRKMKNKSFLFFNAAEDTKQVKKTYASAVLYQSVCKNEKLKIIYLIIQEKCTGC